MLANTAVHFTLYKPNTLVEYLHSAAPVGCPWQGLGGVRSPQPGRVQGDHEKVVHYTKHSLYKKNKKKIPHTEDKESLD